MADTVLSDLVKQLVSIAAELALQEIKLLLEVEDEVQNLQQNFLKVQVMLDKAEQRRQTEEDVKLWYDELKDAYNTMDDLLDSWKTAKIKSQIQKQEEEDKEADANAPAWKKKVCSFLPSPSSCFNQADNLSLRHEIGHKIKTLNETLDKILNDRHKFGIDSNIQPDAVKRPETTSFGDMSKIIGRDKDGDDLLNDLLDMGCQEETNPRVISLVGMGGIGKSTLALLAFNHPKVETYFHIKMWISVPNPFDGCKVAQAIIQEVDPSFPNNIPKLQTLLRKISELITEKRFFLVLDDVWMDDVPTEDYWEPFKTALKCGAQGSRILVTTRNYRVADMMESGRRINLGELSTDDCWSIIKKMAFPSDNQEQHSDLENLGRNLAYKCKGLPLAAKTLGSHMRGKRSKEEWEKVLDSSLWDLENVEKGLLGPLLLSYYELSFEEKQCFLYCAVFPKDHPFDRSELVIHWMAQGYINPKPRRDKIDMEDIAKQYFENLAMHSFFQDFENDDNDGRIIRCKMHDIVHDFAKSMTKDVCFTIDSEELVEKDVKRALQLSLVVKKTVPRYLCNAKNLRFLNLIFKSSQTVQPKLFESFDNLTCLRTLHLKVESIMKLPNEVEHMIHLRYLKLSCSSIKELPETTCNLCNLQSLDTSECSSLKKLPLGMHKLINLRRLILSRESIVFPKGIGKLTCLKTLSDFNIGGKDDKEGCKLGELKDLDQLQGTLRIHVLRNVDVGEAENAQLYRKKHLRGLELDFGFVHEWEEQEQRVNNDESVLNALLFPKKEVPNALKPNSLLESLTIIYYKGPTESINLMMSLTKLKLLDLNCCYNLECLPPLGKLQVLESLFIRGAKKLEKVGDEFLGRESQNDIFPKLKSLIFENLGNWKEWIVMGGTREEEEKDNCFVPKIMPDLLSLSIMGCPKLKSLPDFLRTVQLKELQIHRSAILERRCKPRK